MITRVRSARLTQIRMPTMRMMSLNGSDGRPQCSKKEDELTDPFWGSRSVWSRAAANTTRCLVGCSVGDLSAMWCLQAYAPELSVAATVAASCAAGISTSLLLETMVLRRVEGFHWSKALKTAFGMSMVSSAWSYPTSCTPRVQRSAPR